MAQTPILVPFTKSETISAAWALKADAAEAYCDERLTSAATNYSQAAKLFFAAGYNSKGALCQQLATLIDQEAIAIAAGADDEAQYASDQITDLREAP